MFQGYGFCYSIIKIRIEYTQKTINPGSVAGVSHIRPIVFAEVAIGNSPHGRLAGH
jgi:hypothetical protein